MKKILVTGADGQLGHFVTRALAAAQLDKNAIYTTKLQLDLAAGASIANFFNQHGRFDTILNLAAFTAVDLAESQRELAWQINAEAPALLGAHCERIVHISTDYVFGGDKKTPYTENDQVKPLSYYGESKHAGEVKLLQSHAHAIVVRTAWLYSELPGNFLTKISQLARQKPELKIVADQYGTPTYAADLAQVLVRIVKDGAASGLYHYSNEGETTWYEFAKYFLREQGIHTPVKAIATSEFPLPAKRPAYGVLDKSKIKHELNLKIVPWQESVNVCLKKMS
jgi:dTDP-4-dehydrorhamnose reductase